jgi:ribosomal protein L34E
MIRRLPDEEVDERDCKATQEEALAWVWQYRAKEVVQMAKEHGMDPRAYAEQNVSKLMKSGAAEEEESDSEEEEEEEIHAPPPAPYECEECEGCEWSMTRRTAKRIRHKENQKKKAAEKEVARAIPGYQTNNAPKAKLNLIKELETEKISKVQEEWEEVELAVDSGATETVVGESMIKNASTQPGEASKRGAKYEGADGTIIRNQGEKRFHAESTEGVRRRFVAQVTDVNKGLLSVSKLAKAGHKIVFDTEGSYIEDKATGEVMNLTESGGMYMLKIWVQKDSGF